MPLFRALAKNMAPMTNADESPTNRLTLFPIYLSLFVVSTLCRDITKSSKPARLAIIQLNSLVQKQINMAKPIYDEISKYSQ